MNKLIIIFVVKIAIQLIQCESFSSTTSSPTYSIVNVTSNSAKLQYEIKQINQSSLYNSDYFMKNSTFNLTEQLKTNNRVFNQACNHSLQCYKLLVCKDNRCQCSSKCYLSKSTQNYVFKNHHKHLSYYYNQCYYDRKCVDKETHQKIVLIGVITLSSFLLLFPIMFGLFICIRVIYSKRCEIVNGNEIHWKKVYATNSNPYI